MSVAYSKASTSTTDQYVSFTMASTTETISLLGDAEPTVRGYLKFRTTEANIDGIFDPRIKTAVEAANSIMNFITDKIDETTNKGNQETNQKETVTNSKTDAWDAGYRYSAPQHIRF